MPLAFRFAARIVRRGPGFALAAAAGLALGAGALAAIHGVAGGALLRPMPYAADAFTFAPSSPDALAADDAVAPVRGMAMLADAGAPCAPLVRDGADRSAGLEACSIPAGRAARVDPAVALRAE